MLGGEGAEGMVRTDAEGSANERDAEGRGTPQLT